jgi:hypothetical protein
MGLYIRPWETDGLFPPLITIVPFVLSTPARTQQQGRIAGALLSIWGESESGLGPPGSPSNWRCIALEELSKVKLLRGPWRTAPNHSRPAHCIVYVDIDADDQPERAPQNGQ